MSSRAGKHLRRAVPPPATIPSSTAARVAFNASVTRSFFSFTSTSLEPPTYKNLFHKNERPKNIQTENT